MLEEMVIDVDETPKLEKKVTKSKKRKRDSLNLIDLSEVERETRIDSLKNELDALFKYFKEVSGKVGILEEISSSCNVLNSEIACLLEESDLPFSKLVENIYEKIKMREGITLVSVRSSVLLVGQRTMYGIANADADVLEDCSKSCLWCWETRELKLIPKAQRGILNIRRTCRKKIQDRISAVSAMLAALQILDVDTSHGVDLMKASEKLVKVLSEADIRKLGENMAQKSGTESAEKEAKQKEKELVKELEKNKRETEKEKKRMEREHLKEKLQKEKEQKRLQDEAEKEERLCEAERKKQSRKQQEEAEKDQRRREKEEAQLKQQVSLKRQATLMERFLKSKPTNSSHQADPSSSTAAIIDLPWKNDVEAPNAVTLSMDSTFSLNDDTNTSELYGLHHGAWNKLGRSIRSGNSGHWGMRQKPKSAVIKELKLQGPSSDTGVLDILPTASKSVCSGVLNVEKVVDGPVDNIPDNRSCDIICGSVTEIQICNRIKKLLQFDKSHRPAYYGTLSAKSDVIGPRHPLKRDPNLDYDVESDEEWEEEDPGESLSDCEKDEEEESVVEEISKVDEEDDGSEDGFLVPDGYLSENEGVQVDSMEIDDEDDTRCSPQSKQDLESEEFRALFRQQKYLQNMTEHALQKNQPLIIANLMHEKTSLLTAEDLNGTLKLEQMFLQALSLRPFAGGPTIEISTYHNTEDEDQDVQETNCNSDNKALTPLPVADILDKDLSKIVSSIQSCSQGINKIVESLQQSFPAVPKTQLRSKVRQIADFVDNRWQVKSEILDKLGLAVSPDKSNRRSRGIAAFFSKRCLPPPGGTMKADETSPQQNRKSEIHCKDERCIVDLT